MGYMGYIDQMTGGKWSRLFLFAAAINGIRDFSAKTQNM